MRRSPMAGSHPEARNEGGGPAEDAGPAGWRSHCRHMAQATYDLAEQCEDVQMLKAYLDLAAKWLMMADDPV